MVITELAVFSFVSAKLTLTEVMPGADTGTGPRFDVGGVCGTAGGLNRAPGSAIPTRSRHGLKNLWYWHAKDPRYRSLSP